MRNHIWHPPLSPASKRISRSLREVPQVGKHFKAYVTPCDRHGARYAIDPYFANLTGITEEQITQDGRPLQTALDDLDRFQARELPIGNAPHRGL